MRKTCMHAQGCRPCHDHFSASPAAAEGRMDFFLRIEKVGDSIVAGRGVEDFASTGARVGVAGIFAWVFAIRMSISSTLSDSLSTDFAALVCTLSNASSFAAAWALLTGARDTQHRSQLHSDAQESGRCRTTEIM